MQEGHACSRSMLIVTLVVGSLLQSRWLVLAEEICTKGVSNYTKSFWSPTTLNVSIMHSTIQKINPSCGDKIIFPWNWGDACDTKYRTQYFVKYETKTIMVETHNVTCCHGYEMKHNTCTLSGCPEGTYGDNCTMNCSCPPNAYVNCDNITGHCTCRSGWHAPNCIDACAEHFYGENCTNKCNCKNNGTCDKSIGCVCTSPGWTGQFCATPCSSNTYGINCNTSCSCNDNQTCSPIDGKCTCKPGWTGTDCHDECPEWMYGEGCLHNCKCNRTHSDGCTNVNGHCDCHVGYIGDCNEVCPFGYHGKDCGENCSLCSNTKSCDPVNGTCICLGNKGDNCTEACDTGMYGIDCKMSCNCNSSNSNETCDPTTGECHCLEGWTGRTCNNQCETWTYGVNCRRNCSCDREKATSCDRLNGSCDCINGMGGENCTIDTVAEKQTSGFNSIYIVVLALGICITIIAVGILVYMLIRRKQNKDRRPTDTTQHLNELSLRNTNVSGERATDSDVHTYADIEDQIRGSYIDFNDFKANTTENDASERVSDDQDDSHEQSHYQQLQNTESRVYSQLLKDTPVTDTTYEIPVVSSKTGPISE